MRSGGRSFTTISRWSSSSSATKTRDIPPPASSRGTRKRGRRVVWRSVSRSAGTEGGVARVGGQVNLRATVEGRKDGRTEGGRKCDDSRQPSDRSEENTSELQSHSFISY